ncbi:MAG: hypothetical protein L0332_00630 [Chloroflexi bacterium]|nr:hypothetical protein [Chloroflexota bacterium]MCI0577591.1 hypothetical protein [Chloroflexota bacterium]MCI0644189.1 hypothetical protein [Chloroflexota bacterium]MCI0725228.1 hypothetical protein [Chloroflexota bacterium]
MPAEPIPPEVQFLTSPFGAGLAITLTAIACGATIWWAWRGDHPQRQVILLTAIGSAALLVLVNVFARAMGWWVGPALAPRPFTVLMLLTALGGVPGWTLWLLGYRWLARRMPRPLLAYGLVVLVFIPIVVVVDRWQMARNEFQMAAGYQLWHDVLLGQVVMVAPVVGYEIIQRYHQRGQQYAH